MKRVWWTTLAILAALVCTPVQAMGLGTSPSSEAPTKTNGPLLITGYSLSGHSLKYIQVYNSSTEVVSLDGWKVFGEYSSSQIEYAVLSGKVAPGKYVTVANLNVVPTPTFGFNDVSVPIDPIFSTVSLVPPSEHNFNNEAVAPTVTAATVRTPGTPATFFFARNISASTGNYLTTFTAFAPTAGFTLMSDELYEPPSLTPLQIVEVFPDSSACSPITASATCSDYVKLFNASTESIDLSVFRLRSGSYGQAVSSSNTTDLTGNLLSGEYVSFPMTLNASGSWVWLEDRYGTILYDESVVQYPSSAANNNQAWAYNQALARWQWTQFLQPGNQPNQFPAPVAVNTCSGLVITEIAANAASEDQFVEIFNASQMSVDMAGCVLQTNRSTSASHVFGQENLQPGSYIAAYVKDTPLTLTKTTVGTVYMLSSDMLTEIDQVSYENLSENTSWASVDGTWRQTYAQTPASPNTWLEYPACNVGHVRNLESGLCNKTQTEAAELEDCGAGKYRNLETNRCRALEGVVSLAACDSDQYRSPETNRCRSFVSTASVLAPCASNQERNPETNRCRTSTNTTELSPCAANQERNPDTNRCRNKTSSVAADFPVEHVAEGAQATMGWWAFGGAGTLAAGYAGWEWRREVSAWIKKLSRFGIGRS